MKSKQCYAYICDSISTILISINPYQQLPIYGKDVINHFHNLSKKGQFSNNESNDDYPHPYQFASRVHTRLVKRGVNQSIIVMGESGSGKVEY